MQPIGILPASAVPHTYVLKVQREGQSPLVKQFVVMK